MKTIFKFLSVGLFCVASSANAALLQLSTSPVQSYGNQQDKSSNNTVSGNTIALNGNTWSSISGMFNIIPETTLTFDFMTSDLGEIHGIGFDNDSTIDPSATFQLGGDQVWGIQDYVINLQENVTYSVTINVGQYYTGMFNRIFFVNDEDRRRAVANSTFSNISVNNVSTPSVAVLMALAIAGFAFRRK
ncbi:hypothetical protein [Glaciecola sp. SC05]|uniref:hypothetical protein n=1 Tax=Glaciecola sp. SC05 TaxID=1987355 RepID=UPI0035290BFD